MQDFIDYVLSFYGPNGVYDFNFTESEVKKGLQIHLIKEKVAFAGDSVDREMVRDIVLDELRSY